LSPTRDNHPKHTGADTLAIHGGQAKKRLWNNGRKGRDLIAQRLLYEMRQFSPFPLLSRHRPATADSRFPLFQPIIHHSPFPRATFARRNHYDFEVGKPNQVIARELNTSRPTTSFQNRFQKMREKDLRF